MHELALTQDLVAVCLEHAGGRPIRRLVLEVGKLSGVVPHALRFCFEALQAETPALEGAELEIQEPPGLAYCRSCARELELESAWQPCACGSYELDWRSGRSLQLLSLEVTRV